MQSNNNRESDERQNSTDYNKVRDICFVATDIDEYLSNQLGELFRNYRKRWQGAEKHHQEEAFPLFLVLETINACNLSCEMCFRRTSPTRHMKQMPAELFSSIMAEAAQYGCPSLSLNANNEPLLDKRLPDLVRQARQSGFIDIRINTNGMLLTPAVSEALIEAGLTRLSVSLDAAQPETYARLRHGGNFEQVIGNIRSFLEIRKRKGSRLPVLRCTFVIMPENEKELSAFEYFWRDLADYISIQRYVPHTNDASALHRAAHLPEEAGLTCSQPFERLLIDVDGNVFPCCSPQGQQLPLGSLSALSLKQIWNEGQEEILRQHMRDQSWRQLAPCRLCLTGCDESFPENERRKQ